MRNRLLLFVFFFILAVGTASGLQTIKVAYPDNFYPYCWQDTAGKARGFLIDWWNLWATKAHVNIEFIGASNDECIRLVLNDSADALAGMFFEISMKEHLQFGEYIMRLKSVLFL